MNRGANAALISQSSTIYAPGAVVTTAFVKQGNLSGYPGSIKSGPVFAGTSIQIASGQVGEL